MVKVLMFGWEFPPMNTGGLGTACYGLTNALARNGVEITFVLPYAEASSEVPFMRLIPLRGITFHPINSLLGPYLTTQSYLRRYQKLGMPLMYGESLFIEVARYAEAAAKIAAIEQFDIIHCHDWMTFGAGMEAKRVSGKPLIIHVHATEFDRTASDHVNQAIYDAERRGMHEADHIIAVSEYPRKRIIERYGIPPEKVTAVHNAVEFTSVPATYTIARDDKIVLFLGRITVQKGPDYFIYAAKKVLDYDPHVKFIIAGTGDMEQFIIEKAAEMGIADRVLFAGFLRGGQIDEAYRLADVFVMPSVSEPFGITPLEAMRNGTPVIISKTSGVSEVLHHALKVDFWDVDDIANKIIGILHYRTLHHELKEHGSMEVRSFTWDVPAGKCIGIYRRFI